MEVEEIKLISIIKHDFEAFELVRLTEDNLKEIVKELGEDFVEYSYIRSKIADQLEEKEKFELQFITHFNNIIKIETLTFGDWILKTNPNKRNSPLYDPKKTKYFHIELTIKS